MLYDRHLYKTPFGRAWDRYWPEPRQVWVSHRGPVQASRIDEDDWEFIEHVRMHGRLPGEGTLGAWDVNDVREPVIEPAEIILAASKRTERHARYAKRTALGNLEMAEIAAIQVRNDEAATFAQRRHDLADCLACANPLRAIP